MISIIINILLTFSISADYNIHLNNLQTTKNNENTAPNMDKNLFLSIA